MENAVCVNNCAVHWNCIHGCESYVWCGRHCALRYNWPCLEAYRLSGSKVPALGGGRTCLYEQYRARLGVSTRTSETPLARAVGSLLAPESALLIQSLSD